MTTELKNLCRLCGDFSNNWLDIFQSDDGVKLSHSILKYLSITVNLLDALPKHVCQSCQDKVTSFDEFATECLKVQTILNNYSEKNVEIAENIWDPIKYDVQNVSNEIKQNISEGIVNDIKTEISEEISIKHENDSDWFNGDENNCDNESCEDDDEEYIPGSKYREKDSRKKKVRSKSINAIGMINLTDYLKKKKNTGKAKDSYKENHVENPPQKPIKLQVFKNTDFKYKFVCHKCTDEFSNWSKLEAHITSIHSSKPSVLCICGKYMHTRHTYVRHRREHELNIQTEGYICLVCDKLCRSEKSLHLHSISHLPKEEYPFVCSFCAKRYSTPLKLRIHEKSHIPRELRKQIPCSHCDKTFTTKCSLKYHLMAVESSTLAYVCDVCGNAFRTNANLQSHLTVHIDVRKYSCSKCPKKFKSKVLLKKHLDCHSGTSYKCSMCPAILNSRTTLRNHMHVHDNMCNYVCGLCNKKYKRRKALKSHMNLHTGERPHECPWCPKCFIDNSNLRNHKRRMHPNELAEYEAIHGPAPNSIPRDKNTQSLPIQCVSVKQAKVKTVIVLPENLKPVPETPVEPD